MIKRVLLFLKQLLCFHNFKWDDDYDVMGAGPPRFKCSKCGKKEGL